MNNTLIIEGDKEVSIEFLNQRLTYGGLLEGLPTTKSNMRKIESLKIEGRGYSGDGAVYVIEPLQTPIPYEGEYPFGDPASLPEVVCIAELRYNGASRNKNKDFSTLTLIWFQNDYAFPIDNEIIEKIKLVPFSKISDEFSWGDC